MMHTPGMPAIDDGATDARGGLMEPMSKLLRWIVCEWRLWWHLCPECNSDAPEIDHCFVCRSYSSSRISIDKKNEWRKRYRTLHN